MKIFNQINLFTLIVNMASSGIRKTIPIEKNQSSSKIVPDSAFRRLRIEKNYYYYKDTTTSDKNSIKFQYCCVKKCGVYMHIHKDYRFDQYFSEEAKENPKIKKFAECQKRSQSIYADFTIETIFLFGDHKEGCMVDLYQAEIVGTSSSISSNISILRAEIYKDPFKSSMHFKELLLTKNQKFSLSQVKQQLANIRNELFPKDVEMIFCSEKIWTKDESTEKKQVFCQMKGKFPSIAPQPSKGVRIKKCPEFVLLASNFMLSLLSKADIWFCDATFSIAPKGFYQLLIIMVHSDEYNKNLPCAYITMSGKFQALYEIVFSNLKTLLKQINTKFEKPKKIICDFELGLRNAMKSCFEGVVIDGCYFHFSKALWYKAAKLGLRKSNIRSDTKILIGLLKFLIHLPNTAEKTKIWQDICDNFKSQFGTFLKYFQTYWLQSYSITTEDSDSLRFRTNNICESHNAKLSKFVGVKNPQFGFLLDKLLDIELEERSNHLENVNHGKISQQKTIEVELYLPFSELYRIVEEKKGQISQYNLRSNVFKQNFSAKILKVLEDCENYLFHTKDLDCLDERNSEGY